MTGERRTPTGRALLRNRYLNKGTAFDAEERRRFGLDGLLPPAVETIHVQLHRVELEYRARTTDLDRHIYLRALQGRSSVLFYRFLVDHLDELLPIVYTPTVGLACEQWSRIYRQEHGLYVSWPDRDRVHELLATAVGHDQVDPADIDVVVATDGERVLGLGDLGVGGMGIPIGKLSLYTAVGGIDPARTLPVVLDAGTDNEALLSDPLYLGWRHARVRGAEYDELVDAFVTALVARFPRVGLQWEDFAQRNATAVRERHRSTVCSFNDDIQGTAVVTVAAIAAGLQASGTSARDLRLVVVGAGSAGTGVARQACGLMVTAGLTEAEARARCWLVDRDGLLHDGADLLDIQRPFARPLGELAGWHRDGAGRVPLEEVVRRVAPHALVGVSGQPGLFTEAAVRAMADGVAHPIVLPLSNPTPRAEAQPADVVAWTGGRALVGTGSPFPDVVTPGGRHPVAQVNNVYVFPGVGLGAVVCGARQVTDGMLAAALDAVAADAPAAREGPGAALLPPVTSSPEVARSVAVAVARAALDEGVATIEVDPVTAVDAACWTPEYRPLPDP